MSTTPPSPLALTTAPRFYLGTHLPNWLTYAEHPLFVSNRPLMKRRELPMARNPWAVDSGGFTELNMYGRWQTTPQEYARAVRRYVGAVGKVQFAAIQDWMCEETVLQKTGKTIKEHQTLSVQSYLDLMDLNPDLPWAAVIQGQSLSDYLRCIDMYARAGVDLFSQKVVGVGSVCRRQATQEVAIIFKTLHGLGLKNLHGFGVKLKGLELCAPYLSSSDSLAWSFAARKQPIMPECKGAGHKTCANCYRFARRYAEKVAVRIGAALARHAQSNQQHESARAPDTSHPPTLDPAHDGP